jgi:phosphatidylglycerophosphatase A
LESLEVPESDSQPENGPSVVAQANWAVWPATGLGVGFIKPAPGTWGSLVGMPLAYLVSWRPGWLQAAIIVVFCAAAVPVCSLAGRSLGRGKDPGCIVIDEIAGILITFFLVPMSSIWVAVLGFLLFRAFDISKLPPANRLEHLPEGLGIMADDWAAAVYANLLLQLIVSWSVLFPPSFE